MTVTSQVAACLPLRNADVLPHIPRNPTLWRQVLLELLCLYNGQHGSKPKGVSYKTMRDRRLFVFAFFRALRQDPVCRYHLDPRSLAGRHIAHAVRSWIASGQSTGTIQNKLSHLRVFATWIGKPGFVLPMSAYVADPARAKRTRKSTRDRSWEGNGVDFSQMIAMVDTIDRRVGAQLRMCSTFGLRVREATMLRPRLGIVSSNTVRANMPGGKKACLPADTHEQYLEVVRGTKGGRLRYVPIIDDAQREALAYACSIVSHDEEALGEPGRPLHKNLESFYRVLRRVGITRKKLGVTAHGLRHGFAHRRYQDVTGSSVPIAGGGRHDRDLDYDARMTVAEELGHGRVSITAAYLGHMAQQMRISLEDE